MEHGKEEVRQAVRERYARAATEAEPCCGPSCCGGGDTATETAQAIGYSAEALKDLPSEANLGLGCGNPTAIASLTEGQTVLDLGSGAGIDCFLAAKAVGPTGKVIGVDMTPEMIAKARANAAKGGYTNVEFRLGEIEALPVADGTVDVIISNCVLNLSPEKDRVLADAYRVLKPGGRLVISDMVSDLRVPAVVAGSLDAVAGCLPTLRADYLAQFEAAGFADVRISDEKPYPASYILADPGVKAFMADHADLQHELEAFAGSIFGAHFEAVKRA
jgi:ubiquinone/menaquinone biosynthesis C-methylase UbiE